MENQNGHQNQQPKTVQSISMTVHQPATQQPQAQLQGNWMAIPVSTVQNCPPGLEYLTMIDQLLITQKVHLFEAFTGFDIANKYFITNAVGQLVYFATEESDCCLRYYCGPIRPFEMVIMDNYQREVIHISRPFRFQDCCCPCYLQEIEVSASGSVMGYVKQEWSICTPKFTVENARHEPILKIEGPCIPCRCCADVEFQVLNKDGTTQVGKISKQWSGLTKEFFTDADNFGIQFPLDLDVHAKATLLGAVFLIDFMYFENPNK